ncbi:hypothetical protein HOE425_320401 [Hoeflea sp. EC-HK425]|nr:hypothetical protein HOE425_320401 [Hoeflea sp. EC-HK425]
MTCPFCPPPAASWGASMLYDPSAPADAGAAGPWIKSGMTVERCGSPDLPPCGGDVGIADRGR